VTKDSWKNIEPKTKLGVFVGYTDTPHKYRVYLSTNRMTVVRKDVRFEEEKSMRVSLERGIQLHVDEDILDPNVEES